MYPLSLSPFFFGRVFPHIGHYTVLSTVPSYIQQVFISYLSYSNVYRFPWGFPVVLLIKNPFANTGDTRDTGLIPGSGRSPGGGHGNPLQYSCLEDSMDRGAWWATVHGVEKSWT